jgi:taurine transport system permease protein
MANADEEREAGHEVGRGAAANALARQPMTFRGEGFVVSPRPWAPWIAFAVVVIVWQLTVDRGVVDEIFLPSPRSIAIALYEIVREGDLGRHVGQSLLRFVLGWSIGTIAGLVVGVAMGLISVVRAVSVPAVSALFPIPKIALLPLFILWLGIGESSKIATIALGVFFPTTVATFSAVDSVPRTLIRMAQSFNLPWRAILWKVVLPGALPGILAGFRITTSLALMLLVAAEMIGAQYGLGAFILLAGNLMLTDRLLAGVVILSALGLACSAILAVIERRCLRWR